MITPIFTISYDADDYEESMCTIGIYTDLETAKNKLKDIYNNTPDYKSYGYKINIYNLVGTEYIMTDIKYIYTFDQFSEV
jgi:hypothetical protein